jgi:hypothetical protein
VDKVANTESDADTDADAGPAALSNELLLLSLTSESWEAPVLAGEAPRPRRGHSSVLLSDGKTLAVCGGVWAIGRGPQDEARAIAVREMLYTPLFLLDLESRCWSSVETRGLARALGVWPVVSSFAFHASGLLHSANNSLLFVGGSFEEPNRSMALSCITDRVLVLCEPRCDRAGGDDAGAIGANTPSESHELSGWNWKELRVRDPERETPWGASRMFHAMAQVQGSDLWAIFGGLTDNQQCTNEVALLHLPSVAAGSDCPLRRALQVGVHGQPPSPRNASTLTQLPCGAEGHPRLLVFGGGEFPESYFGDLHVLELLELPPAARGGQAATTGAGGADDQEQAQARQQQPSHPQPPQQPYSQGAGPGPDPRHDGPGMDVEVHLTGGRRLFAARAALVAGSDYFRALWCGPFSEGAGPGADSRAGAGSRPIVRLPGNIDEDEETALLLLKMLCASPRADMSPLLPNSWEALASLLEAAAVVAADAIVAATTLRLASAVDAVNVGRLLALADAQHLPALRQSCLAFCTAHWGAISRAVDLAFPPTAPRPSLRDALAGLEPEALQDLEQRFL